MTGVLRFYGPHHEKGQLRCGVELNTPIGKNDGTVGGHTYFTCEPNRGILCKPDKVRVFAQRQSLVPRPVSVHEALPPKGTEHSARAGLYSEPHPAEAAPCQSLPKP